MSRKADDLMNQFSEQLDEVEKQYLGLRNRKAKKTISGNEKNKVNRHLGDIPAGTQKKTAQVQKDNKRSNPIIPFKPCHITQTDAYNYPPKGVKVSYAYQLNEEDSIVQDFYQSFTGEERSFINGIAKKMLSHYIGGPLLSALNMPAMTYQLLTLALQLRPGLAQNTDPSLNEHYIPNTDYSFVENNPNCDGTVYAGMYDPPTYPECHTFRMLHNQTNVVQGLIARYYPGCYDMPDSMCTETVNSPSQVFSGFCERAFAACYNNENYEEILAQMVNEQPENSTYWGAFYNTCFDDLQHRCDFRVNINGLSDAGCSRLKSTPTGDGTPLLQQCLDTFYSQERTRYLLTVTLTPIGILTLIVLSCCYYCRHKEKAEQREAARKVAAALEEQRRQLAAAEAERQRKIKEEQDKRLQHYESAKTLMKLKFKNNSISSHFDKETTLHILQFLHYNRKLDENDNSNNKKLNEKNTRKLNERVINKVIEFNPELGRLSLPNVVSSRAADKDLTQDITTKDVVIRIRV